MEVNSKKLTRRDKIAQGIEKPYRGSKKMVRAAERKEARKELVFANLSNQPGSPRKYRLVIDMIRGISVDRALAVLKLSDKAHSKPVYKLVQSAIANYEDKFPDQPVAHEDLYIRKITADQSLMLKRIQPAPQGRAHRIRKRYSNIYVELGSISDDFSE